MKYINRKNSILIFVRYKYLGIDTHDSKRSRYRYPLSKQVMSKRIDTLPVSVHPLILALELLTDLVLFLSCAFHVSRTRLTTF